MDYKDNQTINEHNKALFDKLRELNFPTTEYIVVSGGPLAIRGIKKTRDIDLVVSDKFWNELSSQYTPKKIEGHNAEIISLDSDIDVISFRDESNENQNNNPTNDEQLRNAEIIEGLSFQSLRDCLWFKKNSDREKDKRDTELVKEYFNKHPEEAKLIDFSL